MKRLIFTLAILLAFAMSGTAQQKDDSCPRPEGLDGEMYYDSPTDFGDILSWGTQPPEPPIGEWLHYDDGNYATNIGGNGNRFYWASMFPGYSLPPYFGSRLTKVAVYENQYNTEPIDVLVYYGNVNRPLYLMSTMTYNPIGGNAFHEVELETPVDIDGAWSLWIVFSESGSYPASACFDSGYPNNRWMSTDGNQWMDLASSLPGYGWMIRGFVTNQGKEMELIAPKEEKTDDWQLQYYKIYKSETHNNSDYALLDSVHYVEGQTFYEYKHNLIGSEVTQYFEDYYQITAVYSDADGNLCESEPGLTDWGLDYIGIFLTSSTAYDIVSSTIPVGSRWYYEIENENGSVTYQDLEYVADTTINDKTVTIIIRTNTLYDKGVYLEQTREYIYKKDFKIYWWNKDLNEFTLLIDPTANVGDEWDIKVGTETITVHVDAKDRVKHRGVWYDRLYLSDEGGYFSGPALFNIGNMISFFPEKLMNREKDYAVNGLRCYWVDGHPIYMDNETDCDAIWGIDEPTETQFSIYPNPTDGVLVVETCRGASQPASTYRITNLTGQTVLTGNLTSENQRIDVSALPQGMYFITVGGATRKFVIR